MRDRTSTDRLLGAAAGRQDDLRGVAALAQNYPQAAFDDDTPLRSMAALGPGTYRTQVPVSGNGGVNITLQPSLITGACTARVFKTLADGVTEDPIGTPASTALVLTLNTLTTAGLAGLAGQELVIVEFVVPAGGALSFTKAEYRAL